ncbi:E3 ubiquitin-protein ligase TRIM58-like isoform X2 [Pelodiscus sinensis]|uniref:E3 ubiquitin-protein ligase TRIM58-like isoform X2 n=1 Tax=Pelodiscus sinensis TaxID=13735 RepID=UPI003F6B6139
MAGPDPVQELQLEVTCSICTKFLEVPVTLDCGHNYCQACILQYWDQVEEEEEDPEQCPQCRRAFRQRSFRRNKLLANVVAIVRRLPSPTEAQRSRVSTLSEAAPPGQQEHFRQHLETLQRDLETALSRPCKGEMREHLLHFLRAAQQRICQKLQVMEGTGPREPGPKLQDENIPSSRSDSRKPSEARSQTPEPCNCWLPWPSSVQQIQMNHYRVEVTLDPKTASPKLILSSDGRSVQLGDEQKDLPSTCERFDTDPCVLASEGFSSGQYYWEVEVGGAGGWAVGVASKSVKRKGPLYLKPEHGFWTVELHMGKYWALGTCLARVHSSKRLRRVGIYLDCTEGQVAFYNADAFAHLYTFTASFTEEIFPFFYLKDKKTPLVINRSALEGWPPLMEQTFPQ